MTKQVRMILWLVLPALLAACTLFPQPKQAEPCVMRIGALVTLANGDELDLQQLIAYRMAEEEINRAGGVKAMVDKQYNLRTCRLELVIEDDNEDAKSIEWSIYQFSADKNLALVLGGRDEASARVAANVAQTAQLPLLVPGSSSAITGEGYDWIFSLNGNSYSEVTMRFLEDAAVERLAIVYTDTPVDQNLAYDAWVMAREHKMAVAALEAYDIKTYTRYEDYDDLGNKLKGQAPDAVLMITGSVEEASLMLDAFHRVNLDAGYWVGLGEGFRAPQFRSDPNARFLLVPLQWSTSATWMDDNGLRTEDFTRSFQLFGRLFIRENERQYPGLRGIDLTPSQESAQAYSSVYIAKAIIEYANGYYPGLEEDYPPGSDEMRNYFYNYGLTWDDVLSARFAIRQAIVNNAVGSTIYGVYDFNEQGYNVRQALIGQILGDPNTGKNELITIYPEDHADPRWQAVLPLPVWSER